MSARDIRAGKAFVELSIRDKLTQGLKSASGKLRAFGTSVRTIGTAMAGMGASALAPLLGAAKIFADTGSEIHDMSQRTGVAADKLSELKFAAEQTGATFEDVEKAIKFMQKQGISADKFDELAASISSIEDPTKRAALAMKLWGKSGTSILGMAGELPGLRAQAQALGVSMSPEQAKQADDLGDSLGALKAALKGIVIQVGSALAPALIKITEVLTLAAMGVSRFVKANPVLVAAVAIAAVAFIAIGGILIAIGAGLAILATALAAIPIIIAAAGAVFSALAGPVAIVAILFTALAAVTAALIVTFRATIQGFIMVLASAAKALAASPLVPAPLRDFLNGLGSVLGAFRAALPKFPKLRMTDFTGLDGFGESKGGGSSAGAFSGRGAALMGVGPGGGLLKETQKGNKLLDEIRKAVEDATAAIDGLDGQKFE